MTTQQIRSSQIITTYGPGAIVEAPGGPGVMRDIAASGVLGAETPPDYETPDARLSRRLGGVRLFRLPTEAERGLPDESGIYACNAFPGWSMCAEHWIVYQYQDGSGGCPDCGRTGRATTRWQSRSEAIRFVVACLNGHLDDLNWPGLMSHSNSRCPPRHLLWRGGAGALDNVQLECPICHTRASMEDIYRRNHPCRGRFPETETGTVLRLGCSSPGRVLQRNATNLRISEVVTSLTIPRNDDQLHYMLTNNVIGLILLASGSIETKAELLNALQGPLAGGFITASVMSQLDSYPDAEVALAIEDARGLLSATPDMENYRLDELIQLERAAEHGAPPADRQSTEPPDFEVTPGSTRPLVGPGGLELRVTPIERLRVTLAQVGYRRLNPDPAKSRVRDITLEHQGQRWAPAVAVKGEGIFLSLADPTVGMPVGPRVPAWMQRYADLQQAQLPPIGELGAELAHPLSVWWHTLSHRILNAVSLYSGYSSAALRERLYVNLNPSAGSVRGGLLIYTSQPGGDGTLGGLRDTVERFEAILLSALESIDLCSNDPLCSHQVVSPQSLNGAACYACLFLSETSCEARNLGLDRELLRSNLP